MNIKLDISPEKIQKEITSALIKGAIGNKIVEAIEKAIKPDAFAGKDVIEDAVKEQVSFIVRNLIREEYTEQIKSKIKKRLTKDDLVSKFTEDYIDRLLTIDWINT